MKTLVKENIYEQWIGTPTIDVPISYSYHDSDEDVDNFNISDIVPQNDIKLTPEDFDFYIDNLIPFISESPSLALQAFNITLKTHPYLTRKIIGFKGINPYKDSINKFISYFKRLTNKE